jgi:hypothetical protein
MKLNELIKHLKITQRKAKKLDVDVEFLIGEKQYEVDEITQFNIIPDVLIHLKKVKDINNEIHKNKTS